MNFRQHRPPSYKELQIINSLFDVLTVIEDQRCDKISEIEKISLAFSVARSNIPVDNNK